MKIQSKFAVAAVAALAMVPALARTVLAPEYDMSPTEFRIAAVHLSDAATRIDAEIYQRPGWWVKADTNVCLESCVTSNVYPVRRIEGIALRQEVYAGDSARLRATFVFDPLAASDTIFDFVERNGSWNVTGVNLNYRPKGMLTRISGEINGQPSHSWLLLVPCNSDMRVNKSVVIPVENGHFQYDLYAPDTLAYQIVIGKQWLDGMWDLNPFFAEGVPVSINLNVDEGKYWDRIKGGPLTEHMSAQSRKRQEMIDNSGINEETRRLDSLKQYCTPEVYELHDRISQLEWGTPQCDSLLERLNEIERAGTGLTPLGMAAKAKSDSVRAAMEREVEDFIATDGTLVGLETIVKQMHYQQGDADTYREVFRRVYEPRHPGHPYTQLLNRVFANERLAKGYHYPDFSAPDLEGNIRKLSDLIGGKFAVIDLWASWCGSCRRHSIALKPVYEKWKDRGFTIVGVARENGKTRAMEQSIERDGYPWLNLVELNDANGIWDLYMAANSGGRTVLVSPNGIIIAIDPSADEVEDVLQKVLGS